MRRHAPRADQWWLNRAMTATLPAEIQQVFDRFVTTEFTTVDGRGQPITWPLTPYYRLGDPCIDVTTGLGYPKKANDARANPKVALLFSDPTGSGLDAAPQVLVQGIAEVDDRDLDANRERYQREIAEKLPARQSADAAEGLRPLHRLVPDAHLHPRPARAHLRVGATAIPRASRGCSTRTWRRSAPVTTRSPTRLAAPPEVPPAWDARMDELGARYPEAVVVARRARRLPVLGAAARAGGPRGAAGCGSAARPSACPGTRASPASPRTTTTPTSSGSATSRCAATSWRRTAPGRSCRASSSAASSCRRARWSRACRINLRRCAAIRKIAKRELAARGRLSCESAPSESPRPTGR